LELFLDEPEDERGIRVDLVNRDDDKMGRRPGDLLQELDAGEDAHTNDEGTVPLQPADDLGALAIFGSDEKDFHDVR
jgi:hypothetical protein